MAFAISFSGSLLVPIRSSIVTGPALFVQVMVNGLPVWMPLKFVFVILTAAAGLHKTKKYKSATLKHSISRRRKPLKSIEIHVLRQNVPRHTYCG